MKRRAQAAMEFLMTYGWAVLVVLLAIGALAYFGVLSPQNLLPERTVFQAPISNLDNAVVDKTAGTVEVALINNKGVPINISLYPSDWTNKESTGGCKIDPSIAAAVSVNGAAYENADEATGIYSARIENGGKFLIKFNCSNTLIAGGKVKDSFTFYYKNSETGQVIPHTGSVDAKIPV